MMLANSTKSKRFLKQRKSRRKNTKRKRTRKTCLRKEGKRDKQDGELQEKIH
jgi:hypothetical protein